MTDIESRINQYKAAEAEFRAVIDTYNKAKRSPLVSATYLYRLECGIDYHAKAMRQLYQEAYDRDIPTENIWRAVGM